MRSDYISFLNDSYFFIPSLFRRVYARPPGPYLHSGSTLRDTARILFLQATRLRSSYGLRGKTQWISPHRRSLWNARHSMWVLVAPEWEHHGGGLTWCSWCSSRWTPKWAPGTSSPCTRETKLLDNISTLSPPWFLCFPCGSAIRLWVNYVQNSNVRRSKKSE